MRICPSARSGAVYGVLLWEQITHVSPFELNIRKGDTWEYSLHIFFFF